MAPQESDFDGDGWVGAADHCPRGEYADRIEQSGCTCAPGYRAVARSGQRHCIDVDECAMDNGGCGPANRMRCENQPGAAPRCTDIDECAADHGGCGAPALVRCVNEFAAAPNCQDIDECAVENGGCGDARFVACENRVAQGPLCRDVDECAVNNGGCGDPARMRCENLPNRAARCVDIDECTTNNGGCGDPAAVLCGNQHNAPSICEANECAVGNGGCPRGTTCHDDVGSAPFCDVNECTASPNPCGARKCTNTLYSYTCECPAGSVSVFGRPSVCAEPLRQVTTAAHDLCFVTQSGHLHCWSSDLPYDYSALDTVRSYATRSPCALDASGSVVCLVEPKQPVAGSFDELAGSCARRADGSVACWDGMVAPTAPLKVLGNGCGITMGGEILCWSGLAEHPQPAEMPGPYVRLSMGQGLYALRADGTLDRWDAVLRTVRSYAPAPDPGARLVEVSDSCALTASGKVVCWGANSPAQYDDLDFDEPLVSISADASNVCGLTEAGMLRCRGIDDFPDERAHVQELQPAQERLYYVTRSGSIGYMWDDDRVAFPQTARDDPYVSIALDGSDRALALTASGRLAGIVIAGEGATGAGFGTGSYQRVKGYRSLTMLTSVGSVVQLGSPDPVIEGRGYVDFCAVEDWVCALESDGTINCSDPRGALVTVDPAEEYAVLECNETAACVLSDSGKLRCSDGTFGDVTAESAGSTFTALRMNDLGPCALTIQGDLKCWGQTPTIDVQAISGESFRSLALSSSDVCAVRTNGSFRCWGQKRIDTNDLLVGP